MSATPSWFGIAIVLFFAFDVAVTVLILVAVRRKNRYRGFEVITKSDPTMDQQARKD